ncbi:MAG TPA: tetratricopeptide repeat protein [Candidatus Acidoferrum sp.]|nr:tetratricopeptide repeat protein [Candidatus Acidoferrum sp.]
MKRRLRFFSAFLVLLPAVFSAPPAGAIDEIERQWLVGSSAFADGLHPLARRVLERFVAEHPDDRRAAEAFLMLGKARLSAGEAEGALEAFRLAQTFTPRPGAPMEVKLWEAEALLRLKRFAEARAAYDEVFRTDATSPLAVDALYGFGLAELEMKRPESAVSAFRDLLEAWPEHRLAPAATLSMATALADLKRFSEALPLLEGFTRKYPGHKLAPNAQYLLGLTHIQTGDRRTGVADLKAFLDKNPTHDLAPDARRLVTDTLARYGDREDLEESYKTLTTQKPPTAEALYDAAGLAKRLGRPKDQEAMWRRLVDEFPGHMLARRAALELAGLTFKRNQWKDSAAFARAAAESEEDTVKAEGWLQTGEAELKLKHFPAAAKAFESVVTIRNAEAAVRYRAFAGLGLAREEQKDWKAALAAYESAARTPDATLRDWATKRVAAMKSHLGNASPKSKTGSGS